MEVPPEKVETAAPGEVRGLGVGKVQDVHAMLRLGGVQRQVAPIEIRDQRAVVGGGQAIGRAPDLVVPPPPFLEDDDAGGVPAARGRRVVDGTVRPVGVVEVRVGAHGRPPVHVCRRGGSRWTGAFPVQSRPRAGSWPAVQVDSHAIQA